MARAVCYGVLLLLGVGLAAALNVRAPLISNVGWWKTTSFYQIYPRSFMDSNGDGVGDLNGITAKLGYFKDTGIGAIWLSPIYKSPMVDFGYDIANFTEIAEEYGTMTDFVDLTKKAKELNLKVILDLVPNHASDDHEWFKNSAKNNISEYADYFIWRNGKNPANSSASPPNNWISVFGGPAWTWHPTRQQWYFHQFHKRQPDLNYRSHAVRREMANVIRFWLAQGVDGFRVDAVPHLFEVESLLDEPRSNNTASPNEYTYLDHPYTKDQPETYELVKSWRQILDAWAWEEGGDERIMMTEAYTSLDKTVEFYDAGAHIPFNFKFIIDVNKNSTPNDFKKVIDDWTAEATKRNGTSNWVMGNHDRSRIETRYPNRGDHMTMLAMILPGVSVTYYGEEIGMVDEEISWAATQDPQGCQAGENKFKEKSRDPCRTPFQWDSTINAGFSTNTNKSYMWLPVNDNYKTLNLDAQKKATESHYHIYTTLTGMKSTEPALRTGSLKTVVKNSNAALAIVRTHNEGTVANRTVLLVINFSTKNQTVDLRSDIPTNLALKGVVKVATLGSTAKTGASLDLTKVPLGPNNALVIITDQGRTNTNNNNGDTTNGGDSSAISFMKAAIILAAALLITYS